MLIQNATNTSQTPQPAKASGDGAPVVATSNMQTQPGALLNLPQTAVKPAAEQKPSAEQLKSSVDSINKMLKQSNRNLEFSVDETTSRQIVKLVDTETGTVVRQFPSEEMLAISRSIDQIQQGLLLKQEA